MTEHRRIAWLLLLMLTVPGLASAVRQGRLIGKVVDPEGNPLSGVTVTATSPEIPSFRRVMTTDKKGVFKVDFDRLYVVYHYRFEKVGFQTTEVDQTWNLEGTGRHEFTIQRGATPVLDHRPPASTSNAAILAFNAGVGAFKGKDYLTARAKFEEALRHDPNLRPAWAALSLVHLEQEHHQEAAEAAEKAIALGSTDQAVLRSRWEAYRNLGDAAKAQQAREEVEKAGRLAGEAKRIHNEGVALSKAGDDKAAFAKFQQALEADPNLQPALLALAVTGLKVGRPAEAVAAARKILDGDPRHEEALRIQYNGALQLGDEAKVVDALLGLAAVDPVMARDSLFKLAAKAFDSDDAVGAKERFGTVLELDPNHARSHYYLGVILMREGAKSEARSHLQTFLRLAPKDPDAATAQGLLSYLGK